MTRIAAALVFVATLVAAFPLVAEEHDNLVFVKSEHSVGDTADRLVETLEAKGMTVFNRVDHASGAAGVGIDMAPLELVIFGNPAIGSQLMKCGRTIGIDLPMKALIMADDDGVWLAYNSVDYLAERHRLVGCEQALEKVRGALSNFAQAATGM